VRRRPVVPVWAVTEATGQRDWPCQRGRRLGTARRGRAGGTPAAAGSGAVASAWRQLDARSGTGVDRIRYIYSAGRRGLDPYDRRAIADADRYANSSQRAGNVHRYRRQHSWNPSDGNSAPECSIARTAAFDPNRTTGALESLENLQDSVGPTRMPLPGHHMTANERTIRMIGKHAVYTVRESHPQTKTPERWIVAATVAVAGRVVMRLIAI
jgi:hypothetical protein